MANALVLYQSNTGNTAKMAALVAEGLTQAGTHEIRVLSIEDAKAADVAWADGLALGAPTNMGLIPWKMKRFWDEEMKDAWGDIDGKIGCAFASEGGWGGGAEIACMSLLTVLMNFGYLVFGVSDYSGHQHTLHYGATQAGEPREEKEKEACRRLGRRLAEWLCVHVDGTPEHHPLKSGLKRFPQKG